MVWMWYNWLKDKFERNVPYDDLVAGIVTATTREGRSVQEALAYGWIDGQFKSIDEKTHAGRFTPRRPKSNWSASRCR